MTLDEAIKHCEEKAKEIRKANEEMPTDCKLSEDLCECANEHEQLAEWLKELKALKERQKGEWIEDYQPDENPFFQKGWRCSVCGIRTSYGRPEYCMRCGAKMQKGGAV